MSSSSNLLVLGATGQGLRLSRVLTDRDTEYCGNPMTQEQKIIRAKVGLLELAKQLGNVSQA